ncbi:MAG: RNA methyltransferase [Gemmataceae bacterium]|nr:RNA methyltransferase [Gemmataceae bacterium]MCI0739173.1 RNA methyltransferase [Gemmataceae bacterium]
MGLQHCRVVLVETLYPGNLGATARVMRNLGFRDLVLVAPTADPLDERARKLSTHGEDILRRARITTDLGDAVGDCTIVVGTSARTGGPFRRQSVGTPQAILPRVVEILAADQPAALVFGSEPNGLANELVSRCHFLIEIPADPEYPAFNLAQAVAICLYELRQQWRSVGQAFQPADPPRQTGTSAPQEEPASFATQEQMFGQLRVALEELHFLYGDKGPALMHALRHLLGKARPSVMEVQILQGLARQIRWYVQNHPTPRGESSSPAGPPEDST